MADITWKVNIANKKSEKSTGTDPHENSTGTSSDLDTKNTDLVCKRIRPVAGLPNLAYIFLERDDGDKSKVTGRLHVIGNEGEFVHPPAPGGLPKTLWSDDWYDSAGDGSVQAIVTPKDGGEKLRELAGASSVADLKYLDYGTADPQAGSAASITAMPGWVVVGPSGLRAGHGPLRVALGRRLRPRLLQPRLGADRLTARKAHAHRELEQRRIGILQAHRLPDSHPSAALPVRRCEVRQRRGVRRSGESPDSLGRPRAQHPSDLSRRPAACADCQRRHQTRRHAHQGAGEQNRSDGSNEIEEHRRRKTDFRVVEGRDRQQAAETAHPLRQDPEVRDRRPERDRPRNAQRRRVSPEARATDGLRPETGWDVRAGQEPVLQVSALQASPRESAEFSRSAACGVALWRYEFPADRRAVRRHVVIGRPRAAQVDRRHVLAGDVLRYADAARARLYTASVRTVQRLAGAGQGHTQHRRVRQDRPAGTQGRLQPAGRRGQLFPAAAPREPDLRADHRRHGPSRNDAGRIVPARDRSRTRGRNRQELVPVSRGHAALSVDSVQAVHEGSGAFARHVDEGPRHSVERGFQGMRRVLLADLASGTYDQGWCNASELADHAQ